MKIGLIFYYYQKLAQLYFQLYMKDRIVRLQGTQKTMDQDWLISGDFLSNLKKFMLSMASFIAR